MKAIDRYREAFLNEWKIRGKQPCVAIIGKLDFEELSGEVVTLFGSDLKFPQNPGTTGSDFQFEAVHVFQSFSEERGFHFAAMPEYDTQ